MCEAGGVCSQQNEPSQGELPSCLGDYDQVSGVRPAKDRVIKLPRQYYSFNSCVVVIQERLASHSSLVSTQG